MNLSDRLRGIVRPMSGPAEAGPHERRVDVAETLGGEWHEARGHRYLVVDRTYGPGHRHGHGAIADAVPGTDGAWPRLSLLARTAVSGRLMFFDLETTGLAGGAGTYAFLVGCGWFEPPSPEAGQAACFRVRQFFLSAFTAEAAMLAGVSALADEVAAVVTFNGKSFDLPLIENRFVIHRMASALTGLPHIDMLHPARRFWRDGDADAAGQASCRLTALERTQCGFEREGDVPGFEIPSRYFGYVRSGDVRPLAAVLEHNRLDLISLAMLTARTAQMLEDGVGSVRSAREALGLGRIYEQGGLNADARRCYAAAAGIEGCAGSGAGPADAATRAEALRAYALINRRERRFDDAAEAWRRLLELPGCPSALARDASEALAVHHEHRLRDLTSAHSYASEIVRGEVGPSRRQAALYRLARLERKLGLFSSAGSSA